MVLIATVGLNFDEARDDKKEKKSSRSRGTQFRSPQKKIDLFFIKRLITLGSSSSSPQLYDYLPSPKSILLFKFHSLFHHKLPYVHFLLPKVQANTMVYYNTSQWMDLVD